MAAPCARHRMAYGRSVVFFAQDWFLIAALAAFVALNVGIGLLEAWPFALLADQVLSPTPRGTAFHASVMSFLPGDKTGQIISLVAIEVVLQVVGFACWMARMMINSYLNYRGTTRVRRELFAKLQRLSLSYHRSIAQGDSIYRLMTDAFGPWGVMDVVIGTAIAVVTLAVVTVILSLQNVWLAVAAFTVAPFIFWSNWSFGRRIHTRALVSKQTDADLTSHVQQAIVRLPLMQAFRRESCEHGRFTEAVDRSVTALIRLNWQEQLYPLTRDCIMALGAAVILGCGGYAVYQDQFVHPVVSGGMTVGILIVFMDYARRLWDPLKCLAEFFARIRLPEAAAQRVFSVLDANEGVCDRPDVARLPVTSRSLELVDVSFHAKNGPMILSGVSAHIQPGEMVGFLGQSGCGKSCLMSLILRYDEVSAGGILLDGIDVRDIKLADVRAHMAYVGQDSPIFSGTIGENIAYGRPDARPDQIRLAAELSGAAAFIAMLPCGYDTATSEGGSNLSAGQRQRLAIARGLLSDAPILILDEPAGALDPQSERQLMARRPLLPAIGSI